MTAQTEYVEQMIFAGLIPLEALDDDYQEYLKNIKFKDVEVMNYSEWESATQRMKELNEVYVNEIEPLYTRNSNAYFTLAQKEAEKYYWSEVSELEYILGY